MTELQTLESKLNDALNRIQRLEERISAEVPVSPYQFLVHRSHPWRQQLCIKGRNLTVGQLISTIKANQLSPEQASEDLDLPLAAIEEAHAYYESNQALLELEAAEERRRLPYFTFPPGKFPRFSNR